jgi:hypothetical protein
MESKSHLPPPLKVIQKPPPLKPRRRRDIKLIVAWVAIVVMIICFLYAAFVTFSLDS